MTWVGSLNICLSSIMFIGADYLYRVNDDTEFLSLWASPFVYALMQLSPPYGAVGPLSNGTDNRILTHDFVHRTHMEVFGMNYYPPEFTDWWCDDWISTVYGPGRTYSADSVLVSHHTGAHGQRYDVDVTVEKKLDALTRRGREQIRKWMSEHRRPLTELKAFEMETRTTGPFKRASAPVYTNAVGR